VTEIVSGSNLHFRTIIGNCCNFSHAPFIHDISYLRINTNVFKMPSLLCEEIWRFDILTFGIKMNERTVNWIYVAYSQVL
jgi:hypothetical protein